MSRQEFYSKQEELAGHGGIETSCNPNHAASFIDSNISSALGVVISLGVTGTAGLGLCIQLGL